jgi:DNA-binding NtrC family response regulator
LYYRLSVVNLTLPPLRERRDDIPALLRFFLDKHGTRMKTKVSLSPEAFQYLQRYSWPGNIRELENVVLQILSLYPEETIRPESLPLAITGEKPVYSGTVSSEMPLSLREYEFLAVKKALACCLGDVEAAARALAVGKSTLYRKIGEYRIDLKDFKNREGETQ